MFTWFNFRPFSHTQCRVDSFGRAETTAGLRVVSFALTFCRFWVIALLNEQCTIFSYKMQNTEIDSRGLHVAITVRYEQASVSDGIASVTIDTRPCDCEHYPKISTTHMCTRC